MLPYPQYTVKSQDVDHLTVNTLDTLPLTMPGAIHRRDLLRVLVFATAANLSGHQTCHLLERVPRPSRCWGLWLSNSLTSMPSKAMSMTSWHT